MARGSTALAAALLLSVGGVVLAKSNPPDPSIQQQIAPYLTPQRVVHMEKRRTINLVCLGHGSPTVILSAGLGNWSFDWRLVQPALAARTRVCAWDRAGYGFSSPSPEPQDIVLTTADLDRALQGAGIAGPYVMVGQSLGGLQSLRFTDLHRRSVVGMVLVDPEIPGRPALDDRLAPQFAALSRLLEDRQVKQMQNCAAGLRGGTLKIDTSQFERCTASPVPASFPRLKAMLARRLGPAHEAYAALSTRGRHQVVDTTHGIQDHKPAVVVSAVIEVLGEIRASARSGSSRR
jgi:pimeloyl-ACP methyl ester carboxylesterase